MSAPVRSAVSPASWRLRWEAGRDRLGPRERIRPAAGRRQAYAAGRVRKIGAWRGRRLRFDCDHVLCLRPPPGILTLTATQRESWSDTRAPLAPARHRHLVSPQHRCERRRG